MVRSVVFVAAAALLLAASAARAEPNNNPDISVGTCIEHGGSVPQPEGSPIRACCLDGIVAKGCYICDYKWENCVWDPAYSKLQLQGQRLKFQNWGKLSASPGTQTQGGSKLLTPVLKTPLKAAPAQ